MNRMLPPLSLPSPLLYPPFPPSTAPPTHTTSHLYQTPLYPEHPTTPLPRPVLSHSTMSVNCPVPSPTSARRPSCPQCIPTWSAITATACLFLLDSISSLVLVPNAPPYLPRICSSRRDLAPNQVTPSATCSSIPHGLKLSHYLHPPRASVAHTSVSVAHCASSHCKLRALPAFPLHVSHPARTPLSCSF